MNDTIMAAAEESQGGSSPPAAAAAAAAAATGGSGSGSNTPGRVKPALKKDISDATAAAAGGTFGSGVGDYTDKHIKEHRHLKWDEQAIKEHDQLRGTRMKIDEPNTPYAQYDSGAESDDSRRPKSPAHQKPTLSWDVLQTRLDSVAAVRDAYPSSPSSSHAPGSDHGDYGDHSDSATGGGIGGIAGGDERKSEMRKLEFREHRKRHYNEGEALRKFRQEHPGGAMLSDDDAGDDDNNNDADTEKD